MGLVACLEQAVRDILNILKYYRIGLIQHTVCTVLELHMKEVYILTVTDILYNSSVYFQTFRFTLLYS
jgi:hypothetical protein